MNVHTVIQPNADCRWAEAANKVNAWRGACMQCFALAEAATTETLLCLSDHRARGEHVRLRHLVGQRFDDLAQAIDSEGAFAAEGKGAAKALAEFREHEALRVHLAHSVAKVAIERNGQWILVLRHSCIRARKGECSTLVIEEDSAIEQLSQLRRQSRKLCDVLANLRRAVSK